MKTVITLDTSVFADPVHAEMLHISRGHYSEIQNVSLV